MRRISVRAEPFDVGAEFARLTGDAGGIGCFMGVVRRDDGLAALTLEHYPGMTERCLDEIAREAERRFGLSACTVIHRVGRLTPGEPIVLVLTAALHRGEALDATRFLIDWLKTRAPIWKRQEFEDGRVAWVEALEADELVAGAGGGGLTPRGGGGGGVSICPGARPRHPAGASAPRPAKISS